MIVRVGCASLHGEGLVEDGVVTLTALRLAMARP